SPSGWTRASRCPTTCATTPSTTPDPPRPPPVTRPARSGRPPRGAWTPTSSSSMPRAAHGGFYLGSIGGPAARLAQDCIRKVEVLEYEELGMEAIWRIEVVDFPAFVVVDDKGNDFFADVSQPTLQVSFRR